jgi:LCP family protein required for cell wall assembly
MRLFTTPRSRRGALWRAVLAAVIVIGASAATTAVAGLLQFKTLVQDLNVGVTIHDAPVVLPSPGAPQTILIIGSDHRAGEPFKYANTDTMLLVRLNGSSQTINLMSVPRDLQVQIPGVGTSKLNAAYSYGGTKLLVTVLKTQVFPGLQVNHIVDVNFGGFQKLVDAIGCVYTDVDHRYYNDTALTGYSSIDIQAGYQKLCGVQALQFVRFRHTDSDLVRNARQQDFIRWAKDQYGATNLINNRDKLLKIFGAYTETDHNLHTVDGLINLFDLVAFSAGHTIKQIAFPAILQPCGGTATVNGVAAQTPCYVTTNASAEAGVYRAFMRATPPAPPAPPAPNPGSTHAQSQKHSSAIPAGLTTDVIDGRSQIAALSRVAMPVYYPRLIMAGSWYCYSITANCPVEIPSPSSYPRAYTIHDQQGRRQVAYRMTIKLNPDLGEYYGVQGTTWRTPPILDKPSETKSVGGKRLELFANGGKLTDVAWRTRRGVYWISNTLTTDISNQQMVAIAASLTNASS